jgi:GTP-binding protein EngB required for normal cell division
MAHQPVNAALLSLGQDQQPLLNLIDRLRRHAPQQTFPQIVAIGGQSAGKSSLLEALTMMPFPVRGGACTRYPTEFRLRRATSSGTRFSIEGGERRKEDYERVRRLEKATWSLGDKEGYTLEDMFSLAHQEMTRGVRPFAIDDKLVIKKWGPDMPALTIVDLPGLVEVPSEEQTDNDPPEIERLTLKYIMSPQTIILSVVPANTDIGGCLVLKKNIKNVDPTGERTIGVITKPDMAKQQDLMEDFLKLAKNESNNHRFESWYVVLNPKPKTKWSSLEERARHEDRYFESSDWNQVPRDHCGAAALRAKLTDILAERIVLDLPNLERKVLDERDEALRLLSKNPGLRDTVDEMRADINKCMRDSSHLVDRAIEGRYTHRPLDQGYFFKMENSKLRGRIKELNRAFANNMRVPVGDQIYMTSTTCLWRESKDKKKMHSNVYRKKQFMPKVIKIIQDEEGLNELDEPVEGIAHKLYDEYHSLAWEARAKTHANVINAECARFLNAILTFRWPSCSRDIVRRHLLQPWLDDMAARVSNRLDGLIKDKSLRVPRHDPAYKYRMDTYRAENKHASDEEIILERSLVIHEVCAICSST